MSVASEDHKANDHAVDDDRTGLGRLFRAHHDAVFRFCLARTGSVDAAEEATSDTFVSAAQRFAAGEGATVNQAWLITVARRRIIDRWRSNERHRNRLQRLFALPSVEVQPDLRDEVALAALRSLPDRQRAALVLRYLDEYSVSEIAEALGCPYRAAESLLSRARRSFGHTYKELEHG